MSVPDPLQGAKPGAAMAWTILELGGIVTENDKTFGATTSGAEIVQNNPDRVALIFVNVGSNPVYVALTLAGATGQLGVLLSSGGGALVMTLRDDFTLPSRSWFAATQTSTSFVYVIEYIRMVQTS